MHGSFGHTHHHDADEPSKSRRHRPARRGAGDNQADADHLHSHVHAGSSREKRDELATLCASFIKNYRLAEDKVSYLRLAGIPFSIDGADGLMLHLVDAQIISNWQVGTASPAFGSKELIYLPYPGEMVAERETMTFTYVSMTTREDKDLAALLRQRL